MEARLIESTASSAAWNMAIDQVLLDSADSGATLRFYGWRPASLSLGYFQSAADRSLHTASSALPLVRRPTGGGALVHDNELTYCLVSPVVDRFRAPRESRRHRPRGADRIPGGLGRDSIIFW